MTEPKLIYKGRVFAVMSETRRLPDGRRVRLDTIKHPGAVLIIPFLSKDRLILLRQFRPVINAYLYELPAGTINVGETPLACARREIREETGFAAKKWGLLGRIYPVPGYSTERIFIYKARGLEEKPAAGDPDEIIKKHILTCKQVQGLFRAGRIIDAKTISALAFCGWL